MTRTEFLARVRREMAKTPGLFPARPAARPDRPAEAAELIRREMAERWPAALERFREEFERVGGVLHRAPTREAAAQVVAGIAAERGMRRAVSWSAAALDLPLGPALAAGGVALVPAPDGAGEAARLRHRADAAVAELGVTGADLALAETGTLVLMSGAGRPRSTSLLPETHVAVFDRTALVETLEQVGVILEALHVEPDRAATGAVVNFITGPSRTADIELTLTRGVHGPKYIHAVFAEG
ncbi:MAG: lactate utilization protein [Candidatus Rokubacteria bacterium]|nr:lactate utilization protein [Candidatus Rokubacteria bacterium]